ncbi:MAG: LURP-one-related family protein [Acholeplasmatales bacterium]|nr:LURP-one-related family protein [Acholeplasmatales bacterium]
MELAIRNKWVSLGGSSVVRDLNENDVLKVKGKIFTFTAKKYICDLEGNVKYIVRNKFWRLFQRKAFVEDANGNKIATVRRKIFSLHDHYYIYSSLGDLQIRGNIFEFNYQILLNGEEIGHISRKLSLRDSFVLSIDDKYDYVTFVALVIAIDNITDRRHRDSSSRSSSN